MGGSHTGFRVFCRNSYWRITNRNVLAWRPHHPRSGRAQQAQAVEDHAHGDHDHSGAREGAAVKAPPPSRLPKPANSPKNSPTSLPRDNGTANRSPAHRRKSQHNSRRSSMPARLNRLLDQCRARPCRGDCEPRACRFPPAWFARGAPTSRPERALETSPCPTGPPALPLPRTRHAFGRDERRGAGRRRSLPGRGARRFTWPQPNLLPGSVPRRPCWCMKLTRPGMKRP